MARWRPHRSSDTSAEEASACIFTAETFLFLFAVQFNSNRLRVPAALWAVGTYVFMKSFAGKCVADGG